MPELREEPLDGTPVIVAPERATRPDTFRVPPHPRLPAVADCPFCPGNEALTPPEVARRGGGPADAPGWRVRVVPNKYPLLGGGLPGAHEVAILSPAHDRSLAELTDEEAAEVMQQLRDRAARHLADGLVHPQLFVNHGRAAGASIEHPHAQLATVAFVPPGVAAALGRWEAAGRDLLTLSLAAARAEGSVVLDGAVPAWCPVASASPFELVVAHPEAGPGFEGAGDPVVAATAGAVREVLGRLGAVLGDVAYNAVLHSAPCDTPRGFRWYLRVTPRVGVTGGFEAGTGVMVNVMPPEFAAAALRDSRPPA